MAEENKQASAQKKPGFLKGVKAEFKKIVWPDKTTAARETGAVVFFSVVLGVFIAVIDAALQFGLEFII